MKKIVLLMLCVAKLFASELIVENGKTLVLVEDSNEIGKLKEKSQIWIPHPQEKDKSILVLPISYYAYLVKKLQKIKTMIRIPYYYFYIELKKIIQIKHRR